MSQLKQAVDDGRALGNVFHTVLDSTDVLIAHFDRSFTYLYVNRAYTEKSGRSSEELIGRNLFDYFPNEGKRALLENVLATGEPAYLHATPNASRPLQQVDWSICPVRDQDDCIVGVTISGVCVSERLTQSLRHQQIHSSLEHLYGSRQLIAVRADLDSFRIIDVSKGLAELVGVEDRTALVGRSIDEFLLNPEEAAVLTEMFHGQKVVPNHPIQIRTINGDILWVDGTGWVSDDGKSVEIVLRDITECRLQHEQTVDREKLYRQMFEHRSAIKLIIDPETAAIVDANDAACRFYGYDKSDLLKLRITDINIRPREEVETEMELSRSKERSYFRFPHRLSDGTVRQVEVYSGPIEKNGKLLLYSIIHDITDKLEVEQALRESERRYRDIVEKTDDLIVSVDADGRYTYINSSSQKIYGLPPADMLGREFYQFVHPDDLERTGREFNRWISEGLTSVTFQNRQCGVSGNVKHISWNARLCFDSVGNLTRVDAIGRDITDLKNVEDALRHVQNRFRAIADYTCDWEFWCDHSGRLLWVNSSVETLTGYTVTECLAMDDHPLPIIDPEDRVRMSEALTNEWGRNIEFRILRKDGETRWMSASWQPIHVEGEPAGTRGSIYDITDRKNIERELIEKQCLFDEVERISDIGWFYFDIATGDAFWSEQLFRIYRLDRNKYPQAPPNHQFIEMLHPDDRQKMIEMQRECVQEGQILEADFRVIRGDGSIAYIRGSAKTIYDDAGNPVRMVGMNFDITRSRRIEAQLFDHQFVQQEIEKVANLGWFYHDLVSNQIFWSDQLYRLFGESTNTFTPTYTALIDFIHPDDRSSVKANFDRLFTEQTMISNEYRIVTRAGKVRTMLGFARMLRDDSGRPQRVVGAVIDITDRKKHEEEIAKAQKLQSLGSIAGGIAHEFNNLLTGVLGNISLAVSEMDEKSEPHSLLKEAERIADRTRELTTQLLTFSSGGKPVIDELILGEVVQSCVPLLLKRTNCVACYDLPEDLPRIAGDRVQLSQVINNLVLNAREAMEGRAGTIRLKTEVVTLGDNNEYAVAPGLYVCLRVIDQGTGIAEAAKGQIFDPFFSTKKTGHGLGLAASYSIARNHGGHLTLETTSESGSTFALYLPVVTSSSLPHTAHEPDNDASAVHYVLVMDDEETLRRLVSRVLERHGYVVEGAPDGATAIDMVRCALRQGKQYDVAILDLSLPGEIGGEDALAGMRELDPTIKAIVCSGYAEDPVMADHQRYGFDAVLSKPFLPGELIARVTGLIET